MTTTQTPHNFLLHLRNYRPELARRLDGVRGLGFFDNALHLKVDLQSWHGRELTSHQGRLETQVAKFFGPEATLVIEEAPHDPRTSEKLPFPVTSSKSWNHVAFWWREKTARWSVWAVRKPAYERWLAESEGEAELPQLDETLACRGETYALTALPCLLDRLCALAREQHSYIHLVTPFPGDEQAARLEARLYAVKEWGTPVTPGPLLQKFVGRIHYVDPDQPVAGLAVARKAAQGCCPDGVELLK